MYIHSNWLQQNSELIFNISLETSCNISLKASEYLDICWLKLNEYLEHQKLLFVVTLTCKHIYIHVHEDTFVFGSKSIVYMMM